MKKIIIIIVVKYANSVLNSFTNIINTAPLFKRSNEFMNIINKSILNGIIQSK